MRRGFTTTCVGLTVIGVALGAYGLLLIPPTDVPQPLLGSVELDFTPRHQAQLPVTVGVRLIQNKPDQSHGLAPVTEAIDVRGDDLRLDGWSLFLIVPAGVHVIGDSGSSLHVGRYPGEEAATSVSITPGPQPTGGYTVLLDWNDLDSGPIQVRGANLVAAFPTVQVENHTDVGQGLTSVPAPDVLTQRELDVPDDYAFLSGPPPDRITLYSWSWKDTTGRINSGDVVTAMTVEARSPRRDEQLHVDEFDSGILIGVAAAALVAAVQEFLNSATKKPKCPDPAAK